MTMEITVAASLLACAHRRGDGYGRRNTADRAPSAERCGKPWIDAQRAGRCEDHPEGDDRHDGRLQKRHRPGPKDEGERQGRAQEHDAELDVEFDPEALVQAAGQNVEVGQQQAGDQRHQRWLQVEPDRLRPLAQREDDDRCGIEEQEGWNRIAQSVAKAGESRRHQGEPERELGEIARPLGGEIAGQLIPSRPLCWRHGNPGQARSAREQGVGDPDQAKAQQDRPPVILLPPSVMSAGRRRRRASCSRPNGVFAHGPHPPASGAAPVTCAGKSLSVL
jgi:hypothetical protein